MMKVKTIITTVCLFMLAAATSFGQTERVEDKNLPLGSELMPKDSTTTNRFKNYLIAPKGEWQCGISVMYADFTSADSEYMMLLQGLNANASFLRLAPQAMYTFANNHAVGVRFQYTNANGTLDSASADLLGNFSMTVGNIDAKSKALSTSVFQRSYWGLDKRGRVGLFWDYVLGYTRKNTSFSTGEGEAPYTVTHKVHLGFAPGLVYYPMNNVSVYASICLADLSYNYVEAYENNVLTGCRHAWNAQARINVLDLNFGLAIHF